MDFVAVVDQVIALLHQRGRVTYRTLQIQFTLDDEQLAALKDELFYSQPQVVDDAGRGLIWTGAAASAATPEPVQSQTPLTYTPPYLAEKILTSRSALEGERKQVTVLFCDLANSTSIAERIGPEAMHTLLNRFFEVALKAVHRYEGTINQFLGDGFMALFGAPLAHEDHARRAVFAALALQRTLQEADVGKPYGEACQFRMGLNSGLVVVGSIGDNLRMDYSAVGDTTNLAARLQQLAEPGTMLVSESTARLVQGAVRLEALPPVEVKGKTEPVPVSQVVGTLPRRSPIASRSERTLSPFVGRERELSTLEALFTQAASGQGQVVGIIAEAGGGKSRLLYEFRQRLQDKQVTYLEGRCLSYGSSIPYQPIIDVLRHNCGIVETDSPEVTTEKVHVVLHEVGMNAEDSAPYLLQLLGVQEGTERLAPLTPEAIRTRTFETLTQMSLKGSQQRPLIFEIEDVHWVDKTSEAYLASLVESLPGASILLLTSYRPGYRPPWLDKSYATQLSLRSLTLHDSATVVHSTSHDTTLPAHLEHMIIEKADGNPFFLEELTRAVIERNDAKTARDVPDTIQGVLMARIDRLPEAHKRLLQTASVLGREFAPRLLQAFWEETTPLASLLLDLKRLEFLYERARGEGPVYVFKHALIQDVAYNSLLLRQRRALHRAVGAAIEDLYPERLAEHYEELAHHFTQGEEWAKAMAYSTMAGDRAADAFANPEAKAHYARALQAAARVTPSLEPGAVARLYAKHGVVLTVLAEYEGAVAAYQQALELIRQTADRRGEIDVLVGLSVMYRRSHRGAPAIATIEQALAMARDLGDRACEALCLANRAYILSNGYGRLIETMPDAEEALRLAREIGDSKLLMEALISLGKLLQWRAIFDRGLVYLHEGVEIARLTHAGFLFAQAAFYIGHAYMAKSAYEDALQWYQQLSDYASKAGDAFWTARVPNLVGGVHLDVFDLDEALRLNLEGHEVAQRLHPWPEPRGHSLVKAGLAHLYRGEHGPAEACFCRAEALLGEDSWLRWRWHIALLHAFGELALTEGRYDEAWTYATQSLELATQTDSRKHMVRAQRLQGDILAASGRLEEAALELATSVDVAEQLQTPREVWLGQAALGKVLAQLGRDKEAEVQLTQATHTIESIAATLHTPRLRHSFLSAAPVLGIYAVLGHRPPPKDAEGG